MAITPTAAIVGRPNVGKSTLFNRLVGKRQAIVHDQPGVTRDRITGVSTFMPERPLLLIDTGGLVQGEDLLGLNEQVFMAIEECDLLLFVVDGREGLVSADEAFWERLRRTGKPTVVVVNKGDTRAAEQNFSEFYRLGGESQVLVSAEHGRGFGDLEDALKELLPETIAPDPAAGPALAIVGRPNVGKSSIVNRIVGSPRTLVSPQAGTTRDPIDTPVEWEGRPYLLIDTAGIRRRSKVSGAPEELAVMMAKRQIERADAMILVIDASAGVTSGDLAIAGAGWELGRPAVVVINKWDLLNEVSRENLEKSWERLDEHLSKPPRVNVSALDGRGIEKIFPAVDHLLSHTAERLPTAEVNRIFERAIRHHHPPADRGKPWRVYYATQVSTRPPTFMLFANRTLPRGSTYRRYLENKLRESLGWHGIPTRLVIRRRTE